MTGVGVKPSPLLDARRDAVRGEHLEGGALRRSRERVGVLAHVERAVDALAAPVFADRLGDREDVRFVERAAQRRAAVSAGAEAHDLLGILDVGHALEVFALEPGGIDQQFLRRRLSGER